MTNDTDKYSAKAAKARAKAEIAKARAQAEVARTEAESKRIEAAIKSGIDASLATALPKGVGLSLHRDAGGSVLVVSGLNDAQVKRLLPQVAKEIRITVARDRRPLAAAVMRFIREGLAQTVVKIVAGLVVGYLLFRFGLK